MTIQTGLNRPSVCTFNSVSPCFLDGDWRLDKEPLRVCKSDMSVLDFAGLGLFLWGEFFSVNRDSDLVFKTECVVKTGVDGCVGELRRNFITLPLEGTSSVFCGLTGDWDSSLDLEGLGFLGLTGM